MSSGWPPSTSTFHAARRMSRAAVPAMRGGRLRQPRPPGQRLRAAAGSRQPRLRGGQLALLALSTSLAAEFGAQGIRSNIVVPGPTRTPLYDRPGGFGDQAAELWGIDNRKRRSLVW